MGRGEILKIVVNRLMVLLIILTVLKSIGILQASWIQLIFIFFVIKVAEDLLE